MDNPTGLGPEVGSLAFVTTTLHVDLTNVGDLPVFSREQARGWGISDRDLAALCRRGSFRRLARGWYSSRMDATPEELHVLRTVANIRLHAGRSVAVRHSAVLLHGLPLAKADLDIVELARAGQGHGRIRAGVRESLLEGRPTTQVELPDLGAGASLVTVPHAIVGTAQTNNPSAALVAGDHALRLGLCTPAEIHEALADAAGQTGVGQARLALAHLDGRHESPGETLTAVILRTLGWDVDPQVEVVAAGRLYRLDFALRAYRVAIEFDGQVKYNDPAAHLAQERREADLRSVGWAFARLGWDDLDDPAILGGRIRSAIAELDPVA
ncbi:hypothetical protein GCM10027055_18760 [Janibacter alkaliphilus]